jgi:hypothetical protein
MKQILMLKFAILAVLTAAALGAGCGQPASPAQNDSSSQIGHADRDTIAADDRLDGIALCPEHWLPQDDCAGCKAELADKLKPGEAMNGRVVSTNSVILEDIKRLPKHDT